MKELIDRRLECPKCGAISGDDWDQCERNCPMPGSPHYVADALESGVTVKPLEWETWPRDGAVQIHGHTKRQYAFRAMNPFGAIFILTDSEGAWVEWAGNNHADVYSDISEAKAAAQADYDRRIRAALSAPAQRVEERCPDCGREKAANVQDAAAGKCPKWWAVNDKGAERDCERHAASPAPQRVEEDYTNSEPGKSWNAAYPLAASPAPTPHAGVATDKLHRLVKVWGRSDRRDVMLPFLGSGTCGEVADIIRATLEDRT